MIKLTKFSRLGLQLLVHLARHPGTLCSIGEISRCYGESHAHLAKVVNFLSHEGLVETVRGRSGGVRLARPADQITLGAVVRSLEMELAIHSSIRSNALDGKLLEARNAWLKFLDDCAISELIV